MRPIDDMVGGGPFGLEPGQWTDDTSMALCLAETAAAQVSRPFHIRYAENTKGNIAFLANQSMTCSGSGCSAALAGNGASNGYRLQNNDFTMEHLDVDSDGNVWIAMSGGTTQSGAGGSDPCHPDNSPAPGDACDDGSVYAGGNFTHAGGSSARRIARWDGEQWYDVGGGVDGEAALPDQHAGVSDRRIGGSNPT